MDLKPGLLVTIFNDKIRVQLPGLPPVDLDKDESKKLLDQLYDKRFELAKQELN